jgi:hypothetical protein
VNTPDEGIATPGTGNEEVDPIMVRVSEREVAVAEGAKEADVTGELKPFVPFKVPNGNEGPDGGINAMLAVLLSDAKPACPAVAGPPNPNVVGPSGPGVTPVAKPVGKEIEDALAPAPNGSGSPFVLRLLASETSLPNPLPKESDAELDTGALRAPSSFFADAASPLASASLEIELEEKVADAQPMAGTAEFTRPVVASAGARLSALTAILEPPASRLVPSAGVSLSIESGSHTKARARDKRAQKD